MESNITVYERHMDRLEKLNKLEEISGLDVDTLIGLFRKGYTAQCPNCNGSGFVSLGPGIRGIKACPVCNAR